MNEDYSIEMLNISKSFGGVHALKDVSIRFKAGQIHSLVGENGAGKSTLIKILSGMYTRDSGEVIIHGEKVRANSVFEMKKKGVAVIYQEFALASHSTVAENIYLHHLSDGKAFINWKKLNKKASDLIQRLGFDIDPTMQVGELSVAYQQVVEIAKALSEEIDILVLDEPTAVLSPYETEKLFEILKRLRQEGITIIYISHRLEDVLMLSDRISILRDGENAGEFERGEVTLTQLVTAMMGRDPGAFYPGRKKPEVGKELLRAENLNNGMKVQNISLHVNAGEVMGIAGLLGSGKSELVRLLYGADRMQSGTIYVEGTKVKIHDPHEAQKNGINYLSENRKDEGILLDLSIIENITLSNMKAICYGSKGVFINFRKEEQVSQEMSDQFTVKYGKISDPASSLSGGNQQKLSLAKTLNVPTKVLILDEPTRGIDVGAKIEVYNIINRLVEGGDMAVIFVSSEIEEIVGMCDRVIVIGGGKFKGELSGEEITKQRILELSGSGSSTTAD